ncbi:hypothetical protein ACFXKG_18320 [Streptomyces sp. NPDC059255]|uniref:hypothetical protein n=1 Tax=Streptomyces sp. NPDC059255 TaxID=3346793 RepID=UPI00368B49B5
MTARLLASAEPRRTRGGAGGVRYNRPRRRSEQTVWIPESLFRGTHFNDEAVTVYVKVAALDARRTWPGSRTDTDPCTAAVTELADALGLSVSAVERGLKLLNRPGPDGAAPWLSTKQRTHTGGRGRSALRHARLVPCDEAALEVPVTVAEALTPRRFRAYLHLARATAKGLPVTGAELAGELHHQPGSKHAGKPLSETTGRRIMTELDAAGWITLDHRAGYQGRHLVTVHRHPLLATETAVDEQLALPLDTPAPAPSTRADTSAITTDGSGAADHDGSLASKEDSNYSTDRTSQLGGGCRRRRGDRKWVARPVENPGGVPDTFRAGHREKRSNSGGQERPYDGPGLTISARIWQVLAPVHHVYRHATVWEQREIARRIGRQLSGGCPPERLTHRIGTRYATALDPYRGPDGIGRWILGVALAPGGCGLAMCEDGATWPTRAPCPGCSEIAADKAAASARLRREEDERAARAQRRRAEEQWAQRTAAWAKRQEQEAAAARAGGGQGGAQQPAGPVVAQPVPPGPRSGAGPGPGAGPVTVWPRRAPATPPPHRELDAAELAELRAAATPAAITAAVAEHGRTHAVYLYGHALVLRHLNAIDLEGEARAQ